LPASDGSPSGVEAAVCADIAKRQQVGIAKYGMTVAANPLPLREWLQHAYEECLDQAVYLRRAMDELPPAPRPCRKCGGDGIEEIQSGPYFRGCPACGGSGKENVSDQMAASKKPRIKNQ
jgi:hypothetical protein